MPNYQKNKRRRRHYFAKLKTTETVEMVSDDIEDSEKKHKKRSSFRILNGKKQAKKIRRIIILGFIVVLTLVILSVSLLSPTGVGEMYSNFTATFSLRSNLPVELNGTETYNVSAKSNYFYILSDSDISAISNNGKISFKDNHGFSSPVLSESESRVLIYDQNGTGLRIYNAKGLLYSLECKNIIYSADIARNGAFAVAGKAENFTSMVTVYNKNGEMIYEWYCPEETINCVAVAPNGKSVAVSTVSVSGGEFKSTVYILKFDSADPVFVKHYDGEFIYAIDSVAQKSFTVICENRCDIISWKDYSVTAYESEYDVNFVRASSKYTVIVSCRENNDGNFSFSVYNKKNAMTLTFNFEGHIDDFQIRGNNIFILSGNAVYLINSDGKIAKTGESGFGTVKIVPVSSSSCIAVGHNSATKINLQ